MAIGVNNTTDKLIMACDDAYNIYPNSCSHSVWFVITQYKPDQKWMDANSLVSHLGKSADWREVHVNELAKLANQGVLVVGGSVEDKHGHVIVVYPGPEKSRGGYLYYSRRRGKDVLMPENGSFARSMSTSQGSWAGAMSKGDRTVWDSWGDDDKFATVKFWKYVGANDGGLNLFTTNKTSTKFLVSKYKRKIKLQIKSKAIKNHRWRIRTITDVYYTLNMKWQRAFKN